MENQKSRRRPCAKHQAEVAEYYCFICEEFVCLLCRQDHIQQVIDKTDIAATRRKKDVQRTLEESETYFGLEQQRLKVIQNLKSVVKVHETKAMKQLETMANARIEEINRVMEYLSLRIKQLCENNLSEIDMIERPITFAHENNEVIKNWMLHASNEEMLAEGGRKQRKIMESNASLPSYGPPISVVTFIGKPSPDLSVCGILEVKTRETHTVGNIEIENVKIFGLPSNKQILFIFQYKDKEVCMAQQGIEGLSMYMEDGTWKGEMLADCEISAVGLDSDWNLLASVNKEKKIYKISGDQTVTTLFTLRIVPSLIAVCSDGRVVVSQKSSDTLFFFNSGNTQTPFILQNINSINSIQCIAVCKYTNILAVVDKCGVEDIDSGYEYDTLHLFDHSGQNVNKLEKLEVFCIVSDNRGHFLLGGNNAVIIIDTRGNKLANLVCVEHSFHALSLAVDSVNQLWIGGNGQISIFRYPDVSISVTDALDM